MLCFGPVRRIVEELLTHGIVINILRKAQYWPSCSFAIEAQQRIVDELASRALREGVRSMRRWGPNRCRRLDRTVRPQSHRGSAGGERSVTDVEAPGAPQLGEHGRGLRPGELFPDAHPGPGTEGQVRAARLAWRLGVEAVAPVWPATKPALGLEPFRLGPPPRVAMQQSRADQTHRSDRHAASAEDRRVEDSSAEHPRRRPQP